ncbi:MAG: uroporphyrinogen-III synthase [Pseudomonadota bacterium]
MRLILTRTKQDNARTARALLALGHETISAPMLTIRTLAPDVPDGGFAGVIFTSRYAPSRLGPGFTDLPAYCVGAATAAAAKASGFGSAIAGGGTAAALLDHLSAHPPAGPLLYASAADIACDLPKALGDRNIACTRIVVYAAVATTSLPEAARTALNGNTVSGVLLYSARTANLFGSAVAASDLASRLETTTAYTLSPKVAAAAKEAGFWHIITADEPNESALLATLDGT